MAVPRSTRLNSLLQRELGSLLESLILQGRRNVLVTVTGVKIASNLRDATVFVSIYGSEAEQKQLMEELGKKRALLQNALASHVIMKYTPILHFKQDNTAAQADRVMHILQELNLDQDNA
jgi:ribosome-binding factor A